MNAKTKDGRTPLNFARVRKIEDRIKEAGGVCMAIQHPLSPSDVIEDDPSEEDGVIDYKLIREFQYLHRNGLPYKNYC